MKIPNPTESEPLQKHGPVDRKLFRRCPKCGGNGYRGACINCGLTYESDTYFDVRKKSNYDGSTWTIGEWRTVSPPTEECVGLNCSERIIDATSYVPCEVIALVEVDGKIIKGNDRWACEKMRIVRAWEWDKQDSVALSIFAAEMVICNFESLYPEDDRPRKAIVAAKNYLDDPSEENRSAAESAWYAAFSAARSARSAASDSIEEWIIKRLNTMREIIRSEEDATIK